MTLTLGDIGVLTGIFTAVSGVWMFIVRIMIDNAILHCEKRNHTTSRRARNVE